MNVSQKKATMQSLYERYRFFHEHAGYVVGESARCALTLARAEEKSETRGLDVQWEDECREWDGDCPAPPIHVCASVYHPDRPENCRKGDPHFYVLAHIGSIGLNTWADPYVRVVQAELFQEALEVLDDEDEQAARVLEQRPTYAGVL